MKNLEGPFAAKLKEPKNIYGMLLWGIRKLNQEQQQLLVCGFVACLRVPIFVLIGYRTINIPQNIISDVHAFVSLTVKL